VPNVQIKITGENTQNTWVIKASLNWLRFVSNNIVKYIDGYEIAPKGYYVRTMSVKAFKTIQKQYNSKSSTMDVSDSSSDII
tara:strand:- start:303 stop:548 length:246 start_codon:yes stop_codon:yes gene_type:complete